MKTEFKYNRLDKNDVAVLLVDHQSESSPVVPLSDHQLYGRQECSTEMIRYLAAVSLQHFTNKEGTGGKAACPFFHSKYSCFKTRSPTLLKYSYPQK